MTKNCWHIATANWLAELVAPFAGTWETCWQCRTRAAALEQQIHELTGKAESWRHPSPQWMAAAKSELGRRIVHYEAALPLGSASGARPGMAWSAFAALGAVVAMMALFPGRDARRIVPRDAIAHVESAGQALYNRPIEQVFAVRITETLPVPRSADSQLRVWSDSSTGRFASKWTGAGGALKHALWQPSAGTGFVYQQSAARAEVNPALPSADARPLVSLADDGLEPGQLEKGFMRWMEKRSWTPVAFTPELSLWTRRDGALASAETVRDSDGSPLVRITARKQTSRLTAILTVEVDPRTWWPKRQAIRFESSERVVEFRLTSNRMQPVPSSELSAAVFHPDVPESVGSPSPAPSPGTVPHMPELPGETAAPVRAIAERAAETVEAHYVLHEVGACLGEPVKIEEESGGVRVYNLGGASGSWPQTFSHQATLQDVSGALADLRRPMPADLQESGGRVPAGALRHAWALRNLAIDFPADRAAGLPEKSWHLLESMLHDHVSGLRRDLGTPSPSGRGILRTLPAGEGNWREAAAGVFDLLVHIRDEPSSVPPSFDDLDTKLDAIAIGFAAEFLGSQGQSDRMRP